MTRSILVGDEIGADGVGFQFASAARVLVPFFTTPGLRTATIQPVCFIVVGGGQPCAPAQSKSPQTTSRLMPARRAWKFSRPHRPAHLPGHGCTSAPRLRCTFGSRKTAPVDVKATPDPSCANHSTAILYSSPRAAVPMCHYSQCFWNVAGEYIFQTCKTSPKLCFCLLVRQSKICPAGSVQPTHPLNFSILVHTRNV